MSHEWALLAIGTHECDFQVMRLVGRFRSECDVRSMLRDWSAQTLTYVLDAPLSASTWVSDWHVGEHLVKASRGYLRQNR